MDQRADTKNDFLFVNKDQDSKSWSNSRSDNIVQTEILRHAQLNRPREDFSVTSLSTGQRSIARPKLENKTSVQIEDRHGTCNTQPRKLFCRDRPKLNVSRKGKWRSYNVSRAIDSVNSYAVNMDSEMHTIVEYFTRVWMHSGNHSGGERGVAAFAPLWPDMTRYGHELVTEAFQSSSELSMYALLAATSRRMKSFTDITFSQTAAPEYFMAKALRALRKKVSENEHYHARVVLDICFLAIAEMFTINRIESEVYSRLSRHIIASVGGFSNINPIIGHLTASFDYICAAHGVQLPSFTIYDYPELFPMSLGPGFTATEDAVRSKLVAEFSLYNPKAFVLLNSGLALSQTVAEIHQILPLSILSDFRSYCRAAVKQLYFVLAVIFGSDSNKDNPKASVRDVQMADMLSVHLRSCAFNIWLWYSSVGCLLQSSPHVPNPQPPPVIIRFIPEMWRLIMQIRLLLTDSNWTMQREPLLWILAVGYLTSAWELDQRWYQELFIENALELHIHDEKSLETVLAKSPRLDFIDILYLDKLSSLLQLPSTDEQVYILPSQCLQISQHYIGVTRPQDFIDVAKMIIIDPPTHIELLV